MKGLRVQKSNIHGSGIVVTRPVKRGQTISFLKGKICHLEIKSEKDSLSFPMWIGMRKGVWLEPAHPFEYLNHSCEPTAGLRGRVTLVALRDLKPGDEVTVDYSITEEDPLWHMSCSCGSPKCRKEIRAITSLPPGVFNQYMPFVPTYFKRLYLKDHPMRG